MTKNGFMYILTNKDNTVLYIVVTSNLIKRMDEHKHSLADGFTKKYNVNKLVYFEIHEDIRAAILRENLNIRCDWEITAYAVMTSLCGNDSLVRE
ncbi:predicted protein [Francisella tularensis subsp. novicida GA99-3548]|uniref:GIY-YIG nuclease family protein n=1 Tax=Francisella tularensis TaxID=263 RepID=UPI000158B3A9|nr:GIY-YIG nuclease family protein [Francisella tularensis]AJI72824.1 GIY-YIG catalytic domain protein [Francisella tularensis subsp. novicida D9876]EDN38180.1 predicted protein [Francisella tularensis subsp. novicida GA99-3548]